MRSMQHRVNAVAMVDLTHVSPKSGTSFGMGLKPSDFVICPSPLRAAQETADIQY